MKYKLLYLAAGCFWGTEAYFRQIPGILKTRVGYANGKSEDTNYEIVDQTDHAETLEITYDQTKITLEEILLHYFRIINPKSVNRQGNDIGRQYRTGIYYKDAADLSPIQKVYDYFAHKLGKLAVEVGPLKNFVQAEDYHQDYLGKNPLGYCHVNLALAKEPLIAGDFPLPSEEEIKNRLDAESYAVMRQADTEWPGTSPLNTEERRGIYVDKITGEPLFASSKKFDGGCGWPSFSAPILQDTVSYREDHTHGMDRVEVRSKVGGSHLGHVFPDGPAAMGGLRYCINGAALVFIPIEEMEEKGYGDYLPLV